MTNLFNILCIVLMVLASTVACGQKPTAENINRQFSTVEMHGLQSNSIQSALEPLSARLRPSIVQIYSGSTFLSSGTIVSTDGLVVAKASDLLFSKLTAKTSDNQSKSIRLLSQSPSLDLAILRLEGESHSAITLPIIKSTQPKSLHPGTMVITPGFNQSAVTKIGIVGVKNRSFANKISNSLERMRFGATGIAAPVLMNKTLTSGVKVTRVEPRSIAENANLLVDDIVLELNKNPTLNNGDLVLQSNGLRSGDNALFKIVRERKIKYLRTQISIYSIRTVYDQWGGGPFSRRRFNFSNCIIHDTPLHPNQCGSPLCDLDGNVVGINISRSLRSASLAIPIADVITVIRIASPDSRFAFAESLEQSPKPNE